MTPAFDSLMLPAKQGMHRDHDSGVGVGGGGGGVVHSVTLLVSYR